MVLRTALLSATLLAACVAAGSRYLAREPADPCVATPEIHACAVFLQPDWLVRRAQVGRPIAAPAAQATNGVMATEAGATEAGATEAGATEAGPIDAVTTGAITVSDGAPALVEAHGAQEAGL